MSVLTPSIPERAGMLAECEASVAAQTERRWEHLVEVDEERRGCAATMNALAAAARGTWLLPLADDDLLLPGALGVLLAEARRQAERAARARRIVYAQPLVFGNDSRHFFNEPPYMPSFALIPRQLWRKLGGYDEQRRREEDRDLWLRAEAAGAEFAKANGAPVWVYRFHGGNKSYNRGVAS